MEKNINAVVDKKNEKDANNRAADKLGKENIKYNNGQKPIVFYGKEIKP